ncbi:MAG: TauD/TfdA family dioxygenase [Pseudomonadota bacterium]|jgi:alpha-ketoglutarate-dependent 2,4-dichlorophenoxyacetate dioxygenase|nr:TauD/TfdA family dioxygenase [Pseudomonadota bacterium]
MAIEIQQVGPTFAGEVTGVDLTRPLNQQEVLAIEAGMDEFAVLVFRHQSLSDEQQLAFSQNFGRIESSEGGNPTQKPQNRRLRLDMADVSNLDQQQQVFERSDRRRLFNLGNRLWHSDSAFRATPAKYSLLSARDVPENGPNTEYADMRAAYDALEDRLKDDVQDLICEHSLIYSRGLLGFAEFSDDELETMKPVRQVLVRVHPVTGRKSLFLASHAGTIIGWPMAEARIFLRDLIEHATQPQFVYAHRWCVGDLVMWDNRQTMHRVRGFRGPEVKRDVRRTTIAGDGPTTTQVA